MAAVRRFEPGDSAGYGRRWTRAEPTWVATVPIGYGDGWRRALSNNCDVLIGGRRHPLVGTVSMDNVTVELGPDTDVERGRRGRADRRARATSASSPRRWRARLGTINYEVTCGAARRGCGREPCR